MSGRRFSIALLWAVALLFYGWRYSPLLHSDRKMPGNTDVLFLSYFAEKIAARFDQLVGRLPAEPLMQPMYPVEHPETFGESASFAALTLAAFRVAGFNIGASLFLFFVLVSLVNHAAIARLVQRLTGNKAAAFIAGFLPNTSAFAISNTDDPVMLLVAPVAWQLLIMLDTTNLSAMRRMYYSAAILLFCLYWSSYIFFYQTILAGVLFIGLVRREYQILRDKRTYLLAALFLAGLIPYVVTHLRPALSEQLVSPWDAVMIVRDCSLSFSDLIRKPEGMYWFQPTPHEPSLVLWAAIRRTVYPGVLLLLFGAWSIVKNVKAAHYAFAGLALLFLMLSLGPEIRIGGATFQTPLGALMDHVPVLKLHRIPLRAFAYFLVLLLISITLACGESGVCRRHAWLLPLLFFCSALETANSGPRWYSYGKELDRITTLQKWHNEGKLRREDIVLFLPSSAGLDFRNSDQRLYAYNREILYMLMTARLPVRLINGVHGYFPAQRLQADRVVSEFENTGDSQLLAALSVTKIIIIPEMALNPKSWISMMQIGQRYRHRITAHENNVMLFDLK